MISRAVMLSKLWLKMEFRTGSISVSSSREVEVIDITSRVDEWVRQRGALNGLLTLSTRHTTAGLTVNEAEHGLMKDFETVLLRLIPKGRGYQHDRVDSNAHSHLITSVLGMSVSLIVRDGHPVLGTWQRVLFVECDGPRRRVVELGFVGECRVG